MVCFNCKIQHSAITKDRKAEIPSILGETIILEETVVLSSQRTKFKLTWKITRKSVTPEKRE